MRLHRLTPAMVDTGTAPGGPGRHRSVYVAGLVSGESEAGDNSAEVEGLRELLGDALAQLSPMTAEAVLLHHAGAGYRCIGAKLDISKSAAHRMVRDGMNTLRAILGQ